MRKRNPAPPTKYERFVEGVKTFRKSNQTEQDLFNLIVISTSVLRQGDGLLWSDIEEGITEAYVGKEVQEEFNFDKKGNK
jgi:hypothetical protein